MQPSASETVRVIDGAADCPDVPIIAGAGMAKAIVWPGTGARHRSLHTLRLEGSAATVPLSHPSDCVYYVIDGSGGVCDLTSGLVQPLGEGAMVHIDAGDRYEIRADAGGMSLVGGPCPADPAFYAHLRRS